MEEIDDVMHVAPTAETIVETTPSETQPPIGVALDAIENTDRPIPGDRVPGLGHNITEPPEEADAVQQVAERIFPDPAPVGIMAAIHEEEKASILIKKKEKLANEYMHNIDQLLDLSAELSALPESEQVDFNDKIKLILTDLKGSGIDLWKEEKTTGIAREKMIELKSLINTHTDKTRTQQQIVLTKMQSLAQDVMALLEIAKGMLSQDRNSKSSMIRNQRSGG